MGCNWHFQCTPSQKTPPHPRGSVWGISKCKRNKSESFKSTSNTDCPERCNAAASKAAMLVVPTPPRNPENPTTVLFTKPLSLVLVLTHLFLAGDRKSTRLNSSHVAISYAVFCLKKN